MGKDYNLKKLSIFLIFISILTSCKPKLFIKYSSHNFGDGGYWHDEAIIQNKRLFILVYQNYPNEVDNFEAFNVKIKNDDFNYISQLHVENFKNLPNKIGEPGSVDEGIESLYLKQRKNRYSIKISCDHETGINKLDSLFHIFRKYRASFWDDYKKNEVILPTQSVIFF